MSQAPDSDRVSENDDRSEQDNDDDFDIGEWIVENGKLQKELYLERKNNFIRWSGQFSANSSIYDDEEFFGGHSFRPYTPNVPALRFPNDPG